MSEPEIDLLKQVLRTSSDYVEFGCGGSTILASQLVAKSITCVDSSQEWIRRVSDACTGRQPKTIYADIGPLGDWGWPKDESKKASWHQYHEKIWRFPSSAKKADTFLIDGRFRVACFMQVLIRASANPLVVIHDYEREYYHAIEAFAALVTRVDRLAVFRRLASFDRDDAKRCLASHRLDAK